MSRRRPQRLRAVARHLAPAPSAAAASPAPHSQLIAMRDLYKRQNGVDPPAPLAVGDDGALLPETLASLRSGVEAATARADFVEAERLHRALTVLGPQRRPLSWADCCEASTPSKQLQFFLEHGFAVVPRCFEGEELLRLQRSWRRAQAEPRSRWHAAKAGDKASGEGLPHGKLWFDIPVETLFEEAATEGADPILLQLIGPQKLLPVLDLVVGNPALCGIQPRTLTPDSPETVSGYSGFHRDNEQGPRHTLLRPRARVVKAFVYIFDVGPDQGATSVVPGSYRLDAGPQWLDRQFGFGENPAEGGELDVDLMPNAFKFEASAGDCIVFDIASWHSAMPNRTHLEREAVILGYKNASHVGKAEARTGGMPSAKLLNALDEKGLLSAQHKELLQEIWA